MCKELDKFLSLLEEDIKNNPDKLIPMQASLFERVSELVEGIEVDLDKPIEGKSWLQ